MSRAVQRTPTLDEIFHELQRNDRDWLLDTLQQRWKQLGATTKRGTKRGRSPSQSVEPTNYRDPHDLTAYVLPSNWVISEYITHFRAFDWASTSLGSMHTWSPTLRRVTNFLLADPRAAVLYWGKDRVMIYNQAYLPVLAEKHPSALGKPCSEVWPHTEVVDEAFEKGDATGLSSKGDQEEFSIDRQGFLEEVYADWSIVPIADGKGSFAFYNTASEVTAQVQYQRQMQTLLSLERHTLDSKSQSDFWKHILIGLEVNKHEVPFALLYSSQSSRRPSAVSIPDSISSLDDLALASESWSLDGAIGVPADNEVPTSIDSEWAMENISSTFIHAIRSATVQTIDLKEGSMSPMLQRIAKSRAHGDACRMAVLIPIGRARGDHGSGFLLLGINSRRMYDASYESFIRLLHRQLVSTLVSVKMAEDEDRHAQIAALDRTMLSHQLEKTYQEAKDNERRFRTTAETIPIAMYELSLAGDIIYANSAYYELTGIDPNNLYPFVWEDYIDETQTDIYDSNFRLQFKGETVRFEIRLKKPWIAEDLVRGERIRGETWVLSAGYALKNPDGSIRALQGALIDISRQKWMEGFQERKLKEAIELKRQQETFMDMVGHEIRNPLSAITLCASSILESLESVLEASQNEEVMLKRADVLSHIENSEIITTCINHQRRIIDDVLCLSKLDSGLLVVAPCEVQPKALIEQSLRMFAAETEESDIDLRFTIDESYSGENIDWVMLDPSRVLQVFLNLVTNAIKFTRKEASARSIDVVLAANRQRPDRSLNGTVYLDCPSTKNPNLEEEGSHPSEDEVFITISVKDTGCGIKVEELENIFLRFQQSSPKTHVAYGGSGLGLFISRELARLQGGRIGVASEYGKGSTFEFYVRATRCAPPKTLPISHTNGPTRRISLRRKVTAIRNGDGPVEGAAVYHILLVEDNLVNQRVMSKQLEAAGHRVHLANHGGEALEFIKSSRFCRPNDGVHLDVILLDLEMPIMGGLEATRRIRESEAAGEISPSIPIIAVTANARGEQQHIAKEAGVNAVVTKPFQMQELLREVESVLPAAEEDEARSKMAAYS